MKNKLLTGALAALTLVGGTAAFGAAANAAPADYGHRYGYAQDYRYDRSGHRYGHDDFRYGRDGFGYGRDHHRSEREFRRHRDELRDFRGGRYGRW